MRIRWGDCNTEKRYQILQRSDLVKYLDGLYGLVPSKNIFLANVFDSNFDVKHLFAWLNLKTVNEELKIQHEGTAFSSRFKLINVAKVDRIIAQYLINSKRLHRIFPIARFIRNKLFSYLFKRDDTEIILTEYEEKKLSEFQIKLTKNMENVN